MRQGLNDSNDRGAMAAATVIRQALMPVDFETARVLFLEYSQWLNIDLCFQGFNQELATLPGAYAPPSGRLLLAETGAGVAAGCVALRPLSTDATATSCELKRLWVRPQFRAMKVGHALTDAALSAARDIGFRSIKLDTLPAIMPQAVAMYRSFGFTECEPYYHNPIAGSLYMQCAL